MKSAIAIGAFVLLIGGYLFWQHPSLEKIHSITLPPSPPPRADDSFALIVLVKGKGRFSVNDVPMDFEQLKKVIAEKKWDDHAALKIRRAPEAQFEELLPVLDYGRRRGVVQVSIE